MEVSSNIFNIIEILGILLVYRHRWLNMDLENIKIFAFSIGWSVAEMIKHLIFIITDARS